MPENFMLSLQEYEDIAIKLLRKNRLPEDIDHIHQSIYWLALADSKFNEDIGNREGFRKMYFGYGILKLKKSKKRVRQISTVNIEDCIIGKIKIKVEHKKDYRFDKKAIDEMIENLECDEINKLVFRAHFFDGLTLEEIREATELTKHEIHKSIEQIKYQLRCLLS